jgi:hypothetical protein
MHAWTRPIINCHTLLKVLGRLWMVWKASICIGKVSLHLKLEINTVGLFKSVPTDKNPKGLRLGELGGHAAGPYLPNTYVMIGVVECILRRPCRSYCQSQIFQNGGRQFKGKPLWTVVAQHVSIFAITHNSSPHMSPGLRLVSRT